MVTYEQRVVRILSVWRIWSVEQQASPEPLRSEARERVLRAAEQLFSEHGYASVTLRDIARVLSMRQSSLYNHAPGGKEQLFVEVMERSLARHKAGIEQALVQAHSTLEEQFRAIAQWFLSQPPLNLNRTVYADIPALETSQVEHLRALAYQSLLVPIRRAVQAAEERGEICRGSDILAGVFLHSLESFQSLGQQGYSSVLRVTRVEELISLLLDGARPR